ncbi:MULTISPECIES: DUF2971 domain-containing protein [Liquorilactobacillus]|uniref:DUF2971 domain-containing protein n=1 Tax=Liquorilactobacillus TaxID=2767888 RepID=UPI0021C43006|nr:DUF2971 domain-containing protein [Liquorilactobacillus satsumensis]MCP9328692.1 hypothetical protein [Liquorilactobacillus satsumensis]
MPYGMKSSQNFIEDCRFVVARLGGEYNLRSELMFDLAGNSLLGVDYMRLTEILKDKCIPKNLREMIESLSQNGKIALDNYYNEDSDFYKHASPRLIIPELSYDTSIDENLYHYTTIESLIKIVHSKEWLIKQKDFMNDPKEFQYTIDFGITILDSLSATSDEKRLFAETLKQGPFSDSYIWSFAKNKNSQTLFGNYSGNKNGVALGFKLPEIQAVLATHFAHGKVDPNIFSEGDAYVFPLKVIYDKEVQFEYLKPVVEEWLFAKRSLEQDWNDMKSIMEDCFTAITIFALDFKNPLLWQEEEIRFVVTNINADSARHPEAYVGEVPFVKCNIEDTLIREAIVQTGNSISLESLKKLFNKNGFTNIDVKESELPY